MCYLRYYITCLLACALFAMAAAAGAVTTVVKPGDMNGWVLATQTTSCNESPVGEFRMAGPGTAPAGTGSFHFLTDGYNPCTTGPYALEKIYLGTNAFSGVRLDQITSFKYYTYVHARTFDGLGGMPDGQPPEIELITDIPKPGSYDVYQQRLFVYKPWGWWGGHHVAKDEWQEWDLMQTEEGHDHWELLQSDTSNCRGDWSWVVARYPEPTNPQDAHRLATPAVGDYTQGYLDMGDPGDWRLANQSGTSLSIKVGSGKAGNPNENGHGFWNPETQSWLASWAWWRESCGIDAYADKLVIGINGVETTYDFEKGTAMTVGIGTGACRDPIIATAKDNFLFVVFGKVLADPWPTWSDFYLDDGSGKKIRVIANNAASPGEYYRAKGTLEWNSSVGRYDLRSAPLDIQILSY